MAPSASLACLAQQSMKEQGIIFLQVMSKAYTCLRHIHVWLGSGWKDEEWFMCTLCLRSLYVVACLAGQWMKGRWINSVPFSVNKEANKPNELTRLVDG